MRLRLVELQELDGEVQQIKAEGFNRYEDNDGVLYHKGLLFVSRVIETELISQHYNNQLAGYFCINKTKELIGQKYY